MDENEVNPLGKLGRFALLFSLAGMATLYVVACSSQPEEVHLEELAEHEGQYVKVEATVTGIRELDSGAMILTLNQGNASAPLFIERPMESYREGDLVEAKGKVICYEGTYEITTTDHTSVRIVKSWNAETISVPGLAGSCREYDGTNVRVSGMVMDVIENSSGKLLFLLTGSNAYYSVEVVALKGSVEKVTLNLSRDFGVGKGEYLEVCGKFRLCRDFTYRLFVEDAHHSIVKQY